MNISRPTIAQWLGHTEYQDNRGWRKDRPRKYIDADIAETIRSLKQNRIGQKKYFVGSPHVQMDFAKKHPEREAPKLWYIDKVVREAGLQTKTPKPKRKKGGAQYLLYPSACVKRLGTVQQSADFIGKKYITGRSEPVNIFSSSYYAPFKLYEIKRVLAEKATYAIEAITEQWRMYPIPNVLRMDNGLQWRGTARGRRSVGMVLRFLLNLNVIPLFGAPSKPWTNPHIEGHNRVFSEKVWGRNFFACVDQIDQECERFNQESKELYEYRYANSVFQGAFKYLDPKQEIVSDKLATVKGKKIYFIRFVESPEHGQRTGIIILNETVRIPEQYNHQFVFVEWDIEKERLSVYSEFQQDITLIHQTKFTLNI